MNINTECSDEQGLLWAQYIIHNPNTFRTQPVMESSQVWGASDTSHNPLRKKGQDKGPHKIDLSSTRIESKIQILTAHFLLLLKVYMPTKRVTHELRAAARRKQVRSSRNKETDLHGLMGTATVHKG